MRTPDALIWPKSIRPSGVRAESNPGMNMKVARIEKKSYFRSGVIIVTEGDKVTVYPVVAFSKVRKTYISEGILLTWEDGRLGWGKQNIIVDVVE